MSVLGEVLLGLPTGIFTIGLGFCLSWWVSSFLLGGFDAGHNPGGDGAVGLGRAAGSAAGRVPARAGGVGRSARLGRTGRTGRIGRTRGGRAKSGRRGGRASAAPVPASLRWTVGTATSWSVSLFASLIARNISNDVARTAALVVIGIGAFGLGVIASRRFGALLAPMFITPEAPERAALVGSHARIRSTEVTTQAGEAKVVDGKSSGAIVRVRVSPLQGTFLHGDIVQLVTYDEANGVYAIDTADPDLVGP